MPGHTRHAVTLTSALLLLVACADPPAATEDPSDYLPMAEGTRWTYDVEFEGKSLRLATRRYGGDVRERGGEQVRYLFTYGVPGETGEERAKSIYAAPASGLEEFYVDGYIASLQHDPPVPLLREARIGATWTWTGELGLNRKDAPRTSTLVVKAAERLHVGGTDYDTLRIEERATPGAVVITRWLTKDVGMVRMQVEAGEDSFLIELVEYRAPDAP
jgi:hypothetical protein